MIGDKGIRTPDLTGAIRALYQLSYIPIKGTFNIIIRNLSNQLPSIQKL